MASDRNDIRRLCTNYDLEQCGHDETSAWEHGTDRSPIDNWQLLRPLFHSIAHQDVYLDRCVVHQSLASDVRRLWRDLSTSLQAVGPVTISAHVCWTGRAECAAQANEKGHGRLEAEQAWITGTSGHHLADV